MARIVRRHHHIEYLISGLISGGRVMTLADRSRRFALQEKFERRFFPVDWQAQRERFL